MSRSKLFSVFSLTLVIAMVGPAFCCNAGGEAGGNEAPHAYNLYFGDLHAHTSYSDGTGTPSDAYEAAIAAEADFMAVTDHIAIWNAYPTWSADQAEWEDILAAAARYTSDEFVAIPAYEFWLLADLGEVNVFGTPELPPGPPQNRQDRLPDFYNWLAEQGAVGQWNHPTYYSENFVNYSYYDEVRDQGMCLIEAYNDVYYSDSYQMALDAGWHIIPATNSDTHSADWIASHEMRCVLLAESLTHEDLYDAMKACRGYGTLDRNLRIEYTLNGEIMGSNLSDPSGTYEAWFRIVDPDGTATDEITLVEIVTDDGEVAMSIPASGTSFELTVTLESEDARYFYLRISTASPLNLEEAGVTAWTAPVWTGV